MGYRMMRKIKAYLAVNVALVAACLALWGWHAHRSRSSPGFEAPLAAASPRSKVPGTGGHSNISESGQEAQTNPPAENGPRAATGFVDFGPDMALPATNSGSAGAARGPLIQTGWWDPDGRKMVAKDYRT